MGVERLYSPNHVIGGTVYRVVRHLATGGMGTVYDVEDTSVGKRYVLKTLHPDLFGREDLARRMEAEARILGRLQHPNIVEVVTAGTTSDEWRLPYYVMERLNGQNLRTVLEKTGALEASHACRIAIDLLDALGHAHENQVIHRDVKPENIFLHRNHAGTTTTKLLDFGIMRLLDGAKKETMGRFVGTLRYAAPEQVLGERLGPSTDLYSAGLVLYEMLVGKGPFDDLDDRNKIGAAQVHRVPPPPSVFVPVPRALEALVMSALAKDPAQRPHDAFNFSAELRRILKDEMQAQPISNRGAPRSDPQPPPGPGAGPAAAVSVRPPAASVPHGQAPAPPITFPKTTIDEPVSTMGPVHTEVGAARRSFVPWLIVGAAVAFVGGMSGVGYMLVRQPRAAAQALDPASIPPAPSASPTQPAAPAVTAPTAAATPASPSASAAIQGGPTAAASVAEAKAAPPRGAAHGPGPKAPPSTTAAPTPSAPTATVTSKAPGAQHVTDIDPGL
ncbi:MAG: protein kinase [Myxococcales bacterium]|nr:protein kinase [Myxococcales bacterium]